MKIFSILRAVFLFWFLLTTAILCIPARTVRLAAANAKAIPAVHARAATAAYKAFNDEGNWHAAIFFVLGVLAAALLSPARRFAALLLALTAYSFLMELIQKLFVSGRAFQWHDLAWNEAGLGLGLALGVGGRWWLRKKTACARGFGPSEGSTSNAQD